VEGSPELEDVLPGGFLAVARNDRKEKWGDKKKRRSAPSLPYERGRKEKAPATIYRESLLRSYS